MDEGSEIKLTRPGEVLDISERRELTDQRPHQDILVDPLEVHFQ
jgi:hypothetical protein